MVMNGGHDDDNDDDDSDDDVDDDHGRDDGVADVMVQGWCWLCWWLIKSCGATGTIIVVTTSTPT